MEFHVFFLNGLLALLAGVMLNFTPCVLPVIPIKIRTLLSEVKRDKSARLFASLALLGGTLSFFIPLSLATSFMGVLWGEFFQSKIFLGGLSLFLFLSGITTFFEWTPRLPQFLYKMPFRNYLGAFFTGLLAGILSTPCTGPFLGSVLAYTMTQGPEINILIFSSVAVGLSLPYILLLLYPALINRFPKGGQLSQDFKNLLGVILVGGGIFFGQSILPDFITAILVNVLIFAIGVWVIYRIVSGQNWSSRIAPLVVAFLILSITAMLNFGDDPKLDIIGWKEIREGGAASLALEMPKNRMSFIEFTADWCLNCKVLEKTVYSDDEVGHALKKYNVTAIQFDMTEFSEEQKEVLTKFKGRALPYAVLIGADGKVKKTFSGMFNSKTLIDSIKEVSRSTSSSEIKFKQRVN